MTYRLLDGPVWEPGGVTQMPEVVNVTEELVLQLWIVDDGDGAVLVESPRVGLETRAKVSQVGGQLLYHHTSENRKSDIQTILLGGNCHLKKIMQI